MFERGKARGIVWNEVDLRQDQGITDAVLCALLQNKVITVEKLLPFKSLYLLVNANPTEKT